ncbi:MAG: alpha/beta fold hydrolase [Myxococcota bacterium]
MILMWTVLVGCAGLDSFIFNPVHCSTVSQETCEDRGTWDQVCTTCEDAYPWDRSHPWMADTLDDGESVRPIDPATVTQLTIDTADGQGTLDGYLIPGFGENADVTMLYNHGNYAGIEHYLPRLRFLHEAGYTIIVWDYRGYGKSQPDTVPTVEQFEADAQTVRDRAAEDAPDPDRIILYANSLGAIPAVNMGRERPGCAMILEAPLTSLEGVTRSEAGVPIPDSFLSEGRFNNVDRIMGYDGPLFAMIGSADQRFSPDDVEEMVDNAGADPANKELWILDGVQHGITGGGVPEAGLSVYLERIAAFLDEKTDCVP